MAVLPPHDPPAPDGARRDAGFEFKIGYELEYFLVRKTEDGKIEIADPLDTSSSPATTSAR